MPFEDRSPAILRALRGSVDVYEAAIRAAMDRVDSLLAWSANGEDPSRRDDDLGPFALDRIDVARFAALDAKHWLIDVNERSILLEARRVLGEYAALDPRRLIVDVPSGGRMGAAVMLAFADLGRAFGAMLAAEMIRRGRYDPAEHAPPSGGFPRYRWNRAERDAAPPLLVTVDGADVWAGDLAPFVDGSQRLMLLVRSPAPPAPLVRLITPGALVFQTSNDDTAVELLTKYSGAPSIGALVPEGCAEFVHTPGTGPAISQRTTVSVRPQGRRKPLPGWTLWQQDQELQQLLALAAPPPVAITSPAAEGHAATAEPADRLAAWLLAQAEPLGAGG